MLFIHIHNPIIRKQEIIMNWFFPILTKCNRVRYLPVWELLFTLSKLWNN